MIGATIELIRGSTNIFLGTRFLPNRFFKNQFLKYQGICLGRSFILFVWFNMNGKEEYHNRFAGTVIHACNILIMLGITVPHLT